MKLIIQIPCYNEAETLTIALNDLPKHIDGIDEIEYLIINDGSKDDTVKVPAATNATPSPPPRPRAYRPPFREQPRDSY